MSYPERVNSFSELFSLSRHYYFRTLKQIALFILLFEIAKAGFTRLPSLPWGLVTLAGVIVAAWAIFLYAMAIYRTDATLRDAPVSLIAAWDAVKRRIWLTYAACLLIIIGFFLIFQVGRWIILSLFGLSGALGGLLLIVLVGVPMIASLIFFYLTIPLTIIEKEPIWMVFYSSAKLTVQNWLSPLALYVGMAIILMLTSTHSRHSQWLISHHLMEIFDLIVLALLMPLLLNLTLLILRNLRLLLTEKNIR